MHGYLGQNRGNGPQSPLYTYLGFIVGHFPGTLICHCVSSFTSFSKSKLGCKEVNVLSRGYLSENTVTKREMTDNLHFPLSQNVSKIYYSGNISEKLLKGLQG